MIVYYDKANDILIYCINANCYASSIIIKYGARQYNYENESMINKPAFNQRNFLPISPRFYTPPAITYGPAFNAVHSFNRGIAHEFHGGGALSGGSKVRSSLRFKFPIGGCNSGKILLIANIGKL